MRQTWLMATVSGPIHPGEGTPRAGDGSPGSGAEPPRSTEGAAPPEEFVGPDPTRAQDPAGFVDQLNRLRVWAGQPSFRALCRFAERRGRGPNAGPRPEPLAPSTVQEVLAGKRLPRLPKLAFVESFVAACLVAHGVPDDEVEAGVEPWRTAWRAIAEQSNEPPTAAGPVVESPAATPVVAPPWRRWSLVVAAFTAGVVVGAAVTYRMSGDDAPAAPRVVVRPCASAGAPDPTGVEVIGPRDSAGKWWVNSPRVALTAGEAEWRAEVQGNTVNPWDLLVGRGVTLVNRRHYALTFTATATVDVTVRVRVQDSEPPDFRHSLYEAFHAGPVPCRRTFEFTAAKSSEVSEVTFQIGGRDIYALSVRDLTLVSRPGT
ncbi:hypothetical protein Val02_93550 [Virgisporangium aliadipatigenens]|uniref:Uncharacterized protein n=1 Tax=Virgisporangium aliadipatigenens TaxID=741659 RepID=A0A8J3YVJ7_9ACTN|nr:hypothetical protein [Virgisporangium aliadipatigenens]GIJ52469.1 hypothetical protein Val02_93550 [Virgisporangium aliadipatigenens]